MNGVKLIVEGDSDRNFLIDFIRYKFDQELRPRDFILANGNQLKKPENEIRKNSIQGGRNLLVFDANGDFARTNERVRQEISDLSLEVDNVFLLPNNLGEGNLEDLIIQVSNAENKVVFNCIEGYANCLKESGLEGLEPVDEKTKVYIYQNAFRLGRDGDHGKSKKYLETSMWNLDSEYLTPLHEFLTPYFAPDS